jgi:hypothetical protein
MRNAFLFASVVMAAAVSGCAGSDAESGDQSTVSNVGKGKAAPVEGQCVKQATAAIKKALRRGTEVHGVKRLLKNDSMYAEVYLATVTDESDPGAAVVVVDNSSGANCAVKHVERVADSILDDPGAPELASDAEKASIVKHMKSKVRRDTSFDALVNRLPTFDAYVKLYTLDVSDESDSGGYVVLAEKVIDGPKKGTFDVKFFFRVADTTVNDDVTSSAGGQ